MALRKFSFGVATAMALTAASASVASAEPAAPHAFVVWAMDVEALAFGDAIGVVSATPAEAALTSLLGDASDVASVARFQTLVDAQAALAHRAIDSLYLSREDAERLSMGPALALFEVPDEAAPDEELLVLNSTAVIEAQKGG